MRIRSLVGLVPLFACDTIEQREIDSFPRFSEADGMVYRTPAGPDGPRACMTEPGMGDRRLLSLVNADQLPRILARLFDES